MARTLDDGSCLLFQGALNNGYGRVGLAKRTGTTVHCTYAHRAVWEHHHGAVPEGYEVDHTCYQRNCVNILHLRLLLKAENARDGAYLGHGRRWGYAGDHG